MHRVSSAFLHPFATSVVCGTGEPFHRSSRNTSSLCAATLVSYYSSIRRGKALAFPLLPAGLCPGVVLSVMGSSYDFLASLLQLLFYSSPTALLLFL